MLCSNYQYVVVNYMATCTQAGHPFMELEVHRIPEGVPVFYQGTACPINIF